MVWRVEAARGVAAMVQSKALTVDDYLAEASLERAPFLRKLREIARRVLVDHDEQMKYGMPAYVRNGQAAFAFANQVQYVALYVTKTDVLAKNAAALAGIDHGKGCIRFRKPEKIDWALVEKLLTDTRDSHQEPCQTT
jgi:uncharacterized protein YdhG (YjbR/CyaY superfamily)